jgi:hypothetical protein
MFYEIDTWANVKNFLCPQITNIYYKLDLNPVRPFEPILMFDSGVGSKPYPLIVDLA